MEVLTLQTRVYYTDGSINITNHGYISHMEVLILQTREYNPAGSANITNTSLCTQMDVLNITNTTILPRRKY